VVDVIAATLERAVPEEGQRSVVKDGMCGYCDWCEVNVLITDTDIDDEGFWCGSCGTSLLLEPVEVVEIIEIGRQIPVQHVG